MPEFRFAQPQDCRLILRFIEGLAEYEHLSSEVVATPEILHEWLFEKRSAEVIFVLDDGVEAGFALFFSNFSTFLGRAGLYLEDLFVLPEKRGKGLGKALMTELARIACERGYGRFEWSCLDWNTPSLEFYESLGAQTMDDWTTLRVAGQALQDLAASAPGGRLT